MLDWIILALIWCGCASLFWYAGYRYGRQNPTKEAGQILDLLNQYETLLIQRDDLK